LFFYFALANTALPGTANFPAELRHFTCIFAKNELIALYLLFSIFLSLFLVFGWLYEYVMDLLLR